MPRRSSTLANLTGTALTREIESKYDNVKLVASWIDEIVAVSEEDIPALATMLEEAKDFTGITVVPGTVASWDAEHKILTVPTVKGDKGNAGVDGNSAYEDAVAEGYVGTRAQWLVSLRGANGTNGVNGANGVTPIVEFSYDSATGNLQYEITGYTV